MNCVRSGGMDEGFVNAKRAVAIRPLRALPADVPPEQVVRSMLGGRYRPEGTGGSGDRRARPKPVSFMDRPIVS
jgi:hypothetical protein